MPSPDRKRSLYFSPDGEWCPSLGSAFLDRAGPPEQISGGPHLFPYLESEILANLNTKGSRVTGEGKVVTQSFDIGGCLNVTFIRQVLAEY